MNTHRFFNYGVVNGLLCLILGIGIATGNSGTTLQAAMLIVAGSGLMAMGLDPKTRLP